MDKNNIKMLKTHMYLLRKDIKRTYISDERMLELKETTLEIARKIDEESGVKVLESIVNSVYDRYQTLTKRPINRVLDMMLNYEV